MRTMNCNMAPLCGAKFSTVLNGWSHSSKDPCGGSRPANGGLSPHVPNTDPKQDWMLSIPHLPKPPTRAHELHQKKPGRVYPNKRLASHHHYGNIKRRKKKDFKLKNPFRYFISALIFLRNNSKRGHPYLPFLDL